CLPCLSPFSLHDALPIFAVLRRCRRPIVMIAAVVVALQALLVGSAAAKAADPQDPQGLMGGAICHGVGGSPSEAPAPDTDQHPRSEEHTSELQSPDHLVC